MTERPGPQDPVNNRSATEDVNKWLLEGDPAIRWQVLQDLTGAAEDEVAAERERVAWARWGAQLLGAQDDGGTWAQGLYLPKWTSTTYTLLLLRWLGLPAGDPRAVHGCQCLWEGANCTNGGLTFGSNTPETCITGMLVALASDFQYQDPRLDAAVTWLLRGQLADGGWNCRAIRTGSPHTTGRIARSEFTRFPFPPQWHFDILRGLEYFSASGSPPDPRLADAVEKVRSARGPDGRWKRYPPYPGRQWFPLEPPGASRVATLRCLRVLRWS